MATASILLLTVNMKTTSLLLVASLFIAGCATSRGRAVAPAPRGPESAAQRLAGQRAVDPKRHPEDDERRFGVAEARARKAEQARKAREQRESTPGVDVVKDKNEGRQ
jgi:hypothetical protein